MKGGIELSRHTTSPYGPDYYEMKEELKREKRSNEETNVLLKEIANELKTLSSAVAMISKNLEQ